MLVTGNDRFSDLRIQRLQVPARVRPSTRGDKLGGKIQRFRDCDCDVNHYGVVLEGGPQHPHRRVGVLAVGGLVGSEHEPNHSVRREQVFA